jgi:Tol biopolymer transport system component
MSFEQARGEDLDVRTDLFSFGAVLYEMATGQRAFSGATTAVIFHAILAEMPAPPLEVNPELPTELERIINRLLEKDRDLRYQSAADLRSELKRLKRETDSGRVVPRPGHQPTPAGVGPSRRRRWPLVIAGTLATALVALALAWFARHRAVPPPELKQRRLTDNSSDNPVEGAAISPDGRYLAYGDNSGIHIKLIETGETQTIRRPPRLKGSNASWAPVSWFPDATKLVAGGTEPGPHPSIWVVSVLSGSARELRDGAFAGPVSPDGSQIAFTAGASNSVWGFSNFGRELWLMGANGEEPHRIATLDADNSFSSVVWSPDGERLGYVRIHQVTDEVVYSIETRDAKGGAPVPILANARVRDLCWLRNGRTGRMIYSMTEPEPNFNDSNLWKTEIAAGTGVPLGKPTRITNWAGSLLGYLSNTADGKRLAFSKSSYHGDVYVGELEANGRRLKSPRRLTLSESNNVPTGWTADSKSVLFSSDRDGRLAVFKQGLDEDSPERLTSGPQNYFSPRLSPDGSWILCFAMRTLQGGSLWTPTDVVRVPLSGGTPEFVARTTLDYRCARSPANLCLFDQASIDRKRLAFIASDPVHGGQREVMTIDTDPAGIYSWDLSPDGSRVAIQNAGEHEGHIRVLPIGGGAAQDVRVKGWGALHALNWGADGEGFFASSLSGQGATLLHIDLQGRAQALWTQTAEQSWGIPSPDGKKLAILGATVQRNVWMIENF